MNTAKQKSNPLCGLVEFDERGRPFCTFHVEIQRYGLDNSLCAVRITHYSRDVFPDAIAQFTFDELADEESIDQALTDLKDTLTGVSDQFQPTQGETLGDALERLANLCLPAVERTADLLDSSVSLRYFGAFNAERKSRTKRPARAGTNSFERWRTLLAEPR